MRLHHHNMCSEFNEFDRLLAFVTANAKGLSFTCLSCNRIYFRSQVMHINLSTIAIKHPNLYQKCFQGIVPRTEKDDFLCHSCHNTIMGGRYPAINIHNGLYVEKIPEDLKLKYLENACIAKNILFIKLYQLPVSSWFAFKDKMVMVPVTNNRILETFSAIVVSHPALLEH
jgi:hypothetical protein